MSQIQQQQEPQKKKKQHFTLQPLLASDAARCVDIYFAAFQNAHSLACWPRDSVSVRAFWEGMIRDEIDEAGAHWFKAVVVVDDNNNHSASASLDSSSIIDRNQYSESSQHLESSRESQRKAAKSVSTTAGTTRSNTDDEKEKRNVGEKIAGFVKWCAPKPGVFPDTKLPQWPEGADQRLCDETFGAWAQMHREIMADRGHWYLEIIATDPAYQGQGAGSLMLNWGLSRADQDGAEAYLEASPDAVPIYSHRGFVDIGHVDTVIPKGERVREDTVYRNVYMLRQPRAQAG